MTAMALKPEVTLEVATCVADSAAVFCSNLCSGMCA